MITLEAITEITQDHTLRLGLPKAVQPGPHRVVVVIEEANSDSYIGKPTYPLRLAMLSLAGWPEGSTYRRDDIYGDTGR